MSKKYTVFWTKTSQEDLNSIIDYIFDDNIDQALNIFKKIKKNGDDLNKFPYRGRVVPELKLHNIENYREIITNPWRIIYRVEDDKVYILSVFDGRRNIEDILLERVLRK